MSWLTNLGFEEPDWSHMFRVGDRVRILRKDCSPDWNKRKNINGVVKRTDGPNLIYVQPMWCSWIVELYPCELEKI